MNRPPPTLQDQLAALINQYKAELQQFQALGGANSPEAQHHLRKANQIKELLTRFQRQRMEQQQQMQQQQAPPPQPQPQGFDQQQLYAAQQHAQQGQQGAMANMRAMTGLQQQQQQIQDLHRVAATLDQQLAAANNALQTVDNEETRQRLLRNIQTTRAKREQIRQREQMVVNAIRARREAAAGGAGAQGAGPQSGGVGPGAAGAGAAAGPQSAGGAPQSAGPQSAQGAGPGPGPGPQGPQGGVPQGAGAAGPGAAAAGGAQPAGGAPQQPGAGAPHQPGTSAPGAPGTPHSGAATPNTPVITGRTTQSLPIPTHLNVPPPQPVNVRFPRPTLLTGGAAGSAALNSPALARIPAFDVGSDRVLSKRRLSELVAGILGEDSETLFDGDVEELLLDLADEFVTSVTTFACHLAKHRKSDTLEAKDVQMHLESNWNLRIPGFASDEIRSIRKVQPTASYQQKLQGVAMSKSVNK